MNEGLLRDILSRLNALERTSVRMRVGEVTAANPLNVALGGADTSYTDVNAVASVTTLAAGDTVAAMVWGNDLLVLGQIAGPPAWQTVTYSTNWRRRGAAANEEVQAQRWGPWVNLRGQPERITAAFSFSDATREMFTLPVGCRPGRDLAMWVGGQDGAATRTMYLLVLLTTGVCRVDAVLTGATANGGISSYMWLDGVTFSAIA